MVALSVSQKVPRNLSANPFPGKPPRDLTEPQCPVDGAEHHLGQQPQGDDRDRFFHDDLLAYPTAPTTQYIEESCFLDCIKLTSIL